MTADLTGLSPAMRRGLLAVSKEERPNHIRHATLEALRRRGFVERHSLYVTKSYYGDDKGEYRQHWDGWWHLWYLRTAGYEAVRALSAESPAGKEDAQ